MAHPTGCLLQGRLQAGPNVWRTRGWDPYHFRKARKGITTRQKIAQLYVPVSKSHSLRWLRSNNERLFLNKTMVITLQRPHKTKASILVHDMRPRIMHIDTCVYNRVFGLKITGCVCLQAPEWGLLPSLSAPDQQTLISGRGRRGFCSRIDAFGS